jgi:signal peptidase II
MATRWFVFLSLLLAFTDQLTKYLARTHLDEHVQHTIIPGFFRITLNFNEGIAWGMLPQWSEWFTYFAIIMVLVILMILRKLDKDEVWLKIALAFQMAGAMGNMADRLRERRVTDFIDVTLFPHTRWEYDWPIFNLADSYVVIGTIVLVLVLIFVREDEGEEAKPAKVGEGKLISYSEKAEGEWEEVRRLPGSVPADEALVEIPRDADSEMLTPFEEDEGTHREEVEGLLGESADEFDTKKDKRRTERNRRMLGEAPGGIERED